MIDKIPLKKKIALNLYQKLKTNQRQLHELRQIFWESTLRCNLNCLHCGSDCKVDPDVKDMPLEDFLKTIDTIIPHIEPNKTLIIISGGEPLMRKDLEQCGLELYKRGFPWGMVSNGMLLTEKRFQSLLNSGLRSITISFDGLEDSHNWFRGNKNSYKNALNAIKMLPKAKNINYDIATCAHSRNFNELPEIKKLLIEIGIKNWRLFTVFPVGRAKENPELSINSKQFKQLFEFIKETRKEGLIDLSYGCEGFLGNYEGEVRDHYFNCSAGVGIGSILVDGSISACPNLRSNFTQGNIYKDDFMDVWNNKFQNMRDRSWTKIGICKDCKSYKYCEGNGLHLHDGPNTEVNFCHLNALKET